MGSFSSKSFAIAWNLNDHHHQKLSLLKKLGPLLVVFLGEILGRWGFSEGSSSLDYVHEGGYCLLRLLIFPLLSSLWNWPDICNLILPYTLYNYVLKLTNPDTGLNSRKLIFPEIMAQQDKGDHQKPTHINILINVLQYYCCFHNFQLEATIPNKGSFKQHYQVMAKVHTQGLWGAFYIQP